MGNVRYSVAALGLTPLVAGMVAGPATAQSDAVAGGHAKRVSLHHVLAPAASASRSMTSASGSQASSSAGTPSRSPGASGGHSSIATPAAGCTGEFKVKRSAANQILTFWMLRSIYPNDVCIGTVEDSWTQWPDNPQWRLRVRIYNGHGTRVYSKKTGGERKNYHTVEGTQGVHKYWLGPVKVCAAWSTSYYSSGGRGPFYSSTAPVCKSVAK
jgi:hypothetical protein